MLSFSIEFLATWSGRYHYVISGSNSSRYINYLSDTSACFILCFLVIREVSWWVGTPSNDSYLLPDIFSIQFNSFLPALMYNADITSLHLLVCIQ